MAKKQAQGGNRNTVRVGNVAGVSGTVNIAGGNITTQQTTGLSAVEIQQLFDQLYAAIDASPKAAPADKADLKAEVQDIQTTVTDAVQNKQPVDESFLMRHFRNIARMAPDILDVVVATLGSPLARLGVTAKKIADKAKAETA